MTHSEDFLMSTQDYSARDKAVRHNIYASVRRRDGVPHDLFAAYWRDVHQLGSDNIANIKKEPV